MKNLRNRILIAISTLVALVLAFTIGSSKMYSIDPDMWKALGLDPNASSASVPDLEERTNALDLDGDGWITPSEISAVNNGTASSYKSNPAPAQPSSPAPSQPSSKDSGKKDGKQAESVRITVTFTDMFGHPLGSSQVTVGTTIADSQFVKDVPDCDGKKFDRWDYDGGVIEHDFVVRALYK